VAYEIIAFSLYLLCPLGFGFVLIFNSSGPFEFAPVIARQSTSEIRVYDGTPAALTKGIQARLAFKLVRNTIHKRSSGQDNSTCARAQ
jgi:hypothetical protein